MGDERLPKLNVSVATDKNYNEKGETIQVTGKVQEITPGLPVIMLVPNYDNAAYRIDKVAILEDG